LVAGVLGRCILLLELGLVLARQGVAHVADRLGQILAPCLGHLVERVGLLGSRGFLLTLRLGGPPRRQVVIGRNVTFTLSRGLGGVQVRFTRRGLVINHVGRNLPGGGRWLAHGAGFAALAGLKVAFALGTALLGLLGQVRAYQRRHLIPLLGG